MSKLIFCISFLLLPLSITAQQEIEGKVLDRGTGNPLQGANIINLESNKGTATNNEGYFRLKVSEVPVRLKISYVGYQSQTIKADAEEPLTVELLTYNQLDELLVQGVRAEKEQPITQTTIEKKTLERKYFGQGPVFTIEKLTPSVLSHSESGTNFVNYAQMRLRGIDQTRINFTLNGVPLNDMIDQGVFFSNFTDFGNSVESLQVQRGVGTSSNGTASYAGSVNFESEPVNTLEPSAVLQFMGGSFNTYRLSGEVKTGLMENDLAFYSRFTKTLSDGYKFHSGTNSNSFFFSGGYYSDTDYLELTAFLGRTRNELAYLPVFIDDILEEPRTNIVSENDEDDFGQQFVQLQHTRWLREDMTLTSSLYYGGAGGDFPFGFFDAEGEFTQINFPLHNDHYGLMSTLNYERNKLKVTSGIHLYTFKRKNEESVLPDKENPYYSDRSRKDEVSIFSKIDYQVGSVSFYGDLQVRNVWLDLDPDFDFLNSQGIDTDTINNTFRNWTFINPRVGVTYAYSPQLNLYASFGRSGREPTRTDILGSTNINVFNLPSVTNENAVEAEYVNNLEVGVRFGAQKLKTQANFFYMQFDNEIAPIGEFIPEGFVQLRKNIEDSYKAGIEWEWEWALFEDLTFDGNATFMKSNIQKFSPEGSEETFEDVDAILSPEWLVNGGLSYAIIDQLIINFSGRYVGDAFLELTNQPELTLPSFFIVNTQLTFNFWKDHSFIFQANNLTDKLYFTNGAPVDVDFDGVIDGPGYLVQPPRHYYATLKLRF